MEALIRELKEQAKDHIKLGDDYNVAFGRGMGKAIYAIKQHIEFDDKVTLQIDPEPLNSVTKSILKDASKKIRKTIKKKQKEYLNNQYDDLNQIYEVELKMKSLELIIIKHMLEIGKDFNLGKVIEAIEKQL